MLLRTLKAVAAIAVTLASVPSLVSGQPGVPKTPPPQAARAIIQGDQLFLMQTIHVPVFETHKREVEVNGRKEQQTYTVCRYVSEQKQSQVTREQYRVMTVGGNRLSDVEAAARLAAEQAVLVSTSGKSLDPAYQGLYLPETLIVYLRHHPPHRGPSAAPPPPPTGEPPPAPKFADVPPPKGPPPVIGTSINPVYDGRTTANDKVRLSVTDWRPVYEDRPVHVEIKDTVGNTHTVTKMEVVTHWVAQGRWIDIPLADLALIDRKGERLPADARTKLTGGMSPVLLMPPGVEIDAPCFKHFRPETPIVQAELPAAGGQAFPNMLPPHEMIARVSGDKLTVNKPVYEQKVKSVPVTVIVDGKEVTEYKQVPYTVTRWVGGLDYSLAEVRASDAAGKPVDAAALAKRLAQASPVLVWENGTPIGEIYLAPLKPDTLNVVLPPCSPPAPQAPGAAPSPPAPELPDIGSPPSFALARHFGDGNLLVLREPQPSISQFTKEVQKTVDGKVISETVYEDCVVTHWHEHAVGAENYRLLDCSGKLLDEALAYGRLNKETMVLISYEGKRVDPAWLAIYKPHAVVVYLRPQMYGGYGSTEPAPAPKQVRPFPWMSRRQARRRLGQRIRFLENQPDRPLPSPTADSDKHYSGDRT